MKKNLLDWQRKLELEVVGLVKPKEEDASTELSLDEIVIEALEEEYGNSNNKSNGKNIRSDRKKNPTTSKRGNA